MDEPTWTLIAQLRERFAAAPDPAPNAALAFRVLKLTEETGEAAEALIGATGQNPRKGVTHTMDDLANELCDVALTAMLALAETVPDPDTYLAQHVARLTDRTWPVITEHEVPERQTGGA
jgi:NTP pyrophosphatase (non-canonical NTP hydrolase)